jgi:hypothetical protein
MTVDCLSDFLSTQIYINFLLVYKLNHGLRWVEPYLISSVKTRCTVNHGNIRTSFIHFCFYLRTFSSVFYLFLSNNQTSFNYFCFYLRTFSSVFYHSYHKVRSSLWCTFFFITKVEIFGDVLGIISHTLSLLWFEVNAIEGSPCESKR